MGTCDTPHGGPVSPDIPDPHIFQEEEAVLEILEDAGVDSAVNDKVLKIVRDLCERYYSSF